ncbi:MAG: putative rRNA maturation factor [Bacteroidia bacterium]|jgi:probable rRNA maturation factor
MIHYTFHNVGEPPFFVALTPWFEGVSKKLFSSIEAIRYVFCSDDFLLEMNRAQLGHDYYTDIITFDLRQAFREPLDCEVYISIDRVTENAATFNCTFAEELKRVMAHGLLHLSGLNDSTEEEKKTMREAENNLIKSI